MLVRRLLPLPAAVLTMLWLAPVALAHAHYVSSTPGSGAHLAAAPASVSITYDDDLDPNATVIHVIGPDGQDITTGKTVVTTEATRVATVPIRAAGDGTYTVNWHAVADDDKGVTEGQFTFTIDATSTAATSGGKAPALPASGGGGMALRSSSLQAPLSLTVALLVALALTAGVRVKGTRG